MPRGERRTMISELTLDEMRRLVDSNGTGWEWDKNNPKKGHITTREGKWEWNKTKYRYILINQNKGTIYHGICWSCKHCTTSNRPENVCEKCGSDAMEWS
jgi:hypothetical protein